MMTLFSSSSLQLALATTVYIMLVHVLSTCSTKECRLQMTDKMKDRSVIFRNIDIELCQIACINDIFIFASCLQSNDESEKFGITTSVRSKIHPHTPTEPCGSELWSQTSQCLETGCGKKCVQAPSFTELHIASEAGDLSRVKLILSQGRVDINRKEWIGRTPVMLAAGEGHTGMVKLLVSEGADMSLEDKFGINILHSACMGGDVEIVKYVLSRDMLDIDDKVRCGRTPMMLAAENGHRELVELLVSKGAHGLHVDNRGDNILHCACRGGHVEVVKYVLSHDMVDINSRGSKQKTPVMVAAKNRHKEVVELLVSERADVSLGDKDSKNILHYASEGGDVEVVKYVLSHDMVDINSRGWKKRTPVMVAALKGHKEVVELLVSEGADTSLLSKRRYSLLHCACEGGHVEVVKYVLSQDMVDINRRGWQKRTPIMVAALKGHKEVVELLVSEGADVSLVDKAGNNILHCACRGGHVEVVKYVLSYDMVDINSRGWKQKTPVMVAAKNRHKEVVELLVSERADVSLGDKDSKNILHYASEGGDVEVVKYVLSQDMVGINSRGWQNRTPLMVAALNGHKEVVELLVSEGADTSLLSKRRYSLLHCACEGGHVEVVKYVLSQDMVDINSRGWQKRTPIMVAALKGHKEVVELLVSEGADVSLVDKAGNNILHWASAGRDVEVINYVRRCCGTKKDKQKPR